MDLHDVESQGNKAHAGQDHRKDQRDALMKSVDSFRSFFAFASGFAIEQSEGKREKSQDQERDEGIRIALGAFEGIDETDDVAHEEELEGEFRFWQDWVRTRVPSAYPGICEILRRHKDAGGYIAVVSHSMRGSIERDYRENDLPEPDIIFGWEQPPEQRKPNTWPLEQIMERFGLEPQELLVVDDLKPGYDMARAAGVPFAAAGWANDIPEIEQFMRKNCDFYCKTVADLDRLLEE